jgi:hypothetical protein
MLPFEWKNDDIQLLGKGLSIANNKEAKFLTIFFGPSIFLVRILLTNVQ